MAPKATACDACGKSKSRCELTEKEPDGPCLLCRYLALPCVFSATYDVPCDFCRSRKRKCFVDRDGDVSGAMQSSPNQNRNQDRRPCRECKHRGHTCTWPDGERTNKPSYLEFLGLPAIYNAKFFNDLVPSFETLVYPFSPVITAEEIRDAISNMESDFEDAALVCAFGSATIFHTKGTGRSIEDIGMHMESLAKFSYAALKSFDPLTGPSGRLLDQPRITLKSTMAYLYLEISMTALGRFNRSFTFLREAIAMLQVVENGSFPLEGGESSKYQRLYWEAYVHERFLTLAGSFPSILPPLPSGLPTHDPTLPPIVEFNFNRIIRLFRILDRRFLAHWMHYSGKEALDDPIPELTEQWIEKKKAEIAADELQPDDGGALTHMQVADMLLNRLWLRSVLFQLSLKAQPQQSAHGLLFPAGQLAPQLHILMETLGEEDVLGSRGAAILKKLFDITRAATEAITLAADAIHAVGFDTRAQISDVLSLIRLFFRFETAENDRKRHLRDLLTRVQQQYPNLADYTLSP